MSWLVKKFQNNPILRSSVLIAVISLIGRSFGYLEKLVLSYYFGTSSKIDVYTVVITIITSVFIFFRELVEPGFLKVFLQALQKKDKKGAWTFFNRAGILILIVTIALSVLVLFKASDIIAIFAPGFTGNKKAMAGILFRYAYPATIFLGLTALTGITLNAQKRFVLSASGELVFKLTILATIVVLFRKLGIYAVAAGVVVGAFLKLMVHVAGLYRQHAGGEKRLNRGYAAEAWKLTWPLLIGVCFSQLSSLADNFFASYMKEGTIAALGYAKKVVELPVLIFPYMLSVVIFPYFSELAIARESQKLSGLLSQALAWMIAVFLPLTVFFYFFSTELVELIFQRGAFDAGSTQLTAYPLKIYAFGMVAFAIETVIVVFYFSNSNTKFPILIGVLCVIENIALAWLLIRSVGYAGIALGLVISKSTKVAVLIGHSVKTKMADLQPLRSFLAKPVVATLALVPLLALLKQAIAGVDRHTKAWDAGIMAAAFVVCLLVYLVLFRLVRANKELLVKVSYPEQGI